MWPSCSTPKVQSISILFVVSGGTDPEAIRRRRHVQWCLAQNDCLVRWSLIVSPAPGWGHCMAINTTTIQELQHDDRSRITFDHCLMQRRPVPMMLLYGMGKGAMTWISSEEPVTDAPASKRTSTTCVTHHTGVVDRSSSKPPSPLDISTIERLPAPPTRRQTYPVMSREGSGPHLQLYLHFWLVPPLCPALGKHLQGAVLAMMRLFQGHQKTGQPHQSMFKNFWDRGSLTYQVDIIAVCLHNSKMKMSGERSELQGRTTAVRMMIRITTIKGGIETKAPMITTLQVGWCNETSKTALHLFTKDSGSH
ncbi:hypothetical protein BKA70DRAFT_251509 [Coprinopsis sp. MPI-PUGE-AT-0042]|nr:hypothetical protein BKA70DRAFT_251509 [Coprinopsis sp. MPI-PUGE-AT-0042]